MDYINKETQEITSIKNVQRITGASIPMGQVYENWFPIIPSDPPVAGENQIVETALPVQDGDGWVMGWTLRDMTQEEIEARDRAQVPSFVTMRQARLALLGAGILSQVDGAIDSLEEPAKSAARIEWEYSQTVERRTPFVLILGEALGLTETQIDDLFKTAVQL